MNDATSLSFNLDTSTSRLDSVCLRCDAVFSFPFYIHVYEWCSHGNTSPTAISEA